MSVGTIVNVKFDLTGKLGKFIIVGLAEASPPEFKLSN